MLTITLSPPEWYWIGEAARHAANTYRDHYRRNARWRSNGPLHDTHMLTALLTAEQAARDVAAVCVAAMELKGQPAPIEATIHAARSVPVWLRALAATAGGASSYPNWDRERPWIVALADKLHLACETAESAENALRTIRAKYA